MRQPHERDESTDATCEGGSPREVMRQAARDLDAGLEDTEHRGKAREVFERSGGNRRRARRQPKGTGT